MPKASRTAPSTAPRSACPVAASLDLLGDRWTLLVVRDLFRGFHRYGEFLGSPEAIPTNILADRLRRLEQAGIITREPYQQNPPRYGYSLTPKGQELKPVIGSLANWAVRHVRGVQPDKNLATLLRA